MQTISEYKGIALPWDLFLIPEGPAVKARDNHGEYQVMTGLEGTGTCWLCGADPGGKRYRRYCWGHGRIYYELFHWSYASPAAIERAGYCCENCGVKDVATRQGRLEVHHIIPLEGGPRLWTFLNLPWNLIAFCHDCHQEIHAVMRPNGWDKILWKAQDRGQLVLEGMV
ncbi:hypothetical protein LCGC14_1900370 [marine sediment metagenome]|uniref:HNH domain-containing protein n=1 Tax=marine sediment metagenome TaxID=412755 RepID=A0A0F9FX17_9ZZZZ